MPCPDLKVCHDTSRLRLTPPPTFHVQGLRSHSVSLFAIRDSLVSNASRLVSRIPKELELPLFFVFASDQTVLPPWWPGRGSGLFKLGQCPIIIPKSHVLLEAFMLLYARDWEKRTSGFSMAMIAYIEQYVDEDGF